MDLQSHDHDSPHPPHVPRLAMANVLRAPASSSVALAVLLNAVVHRIATEGVPSSVIGWVVLVLTTLASLLGMLARDDDK